MSGVTVRFIGSGPYCYANSLAMMLGSAAPEPAVIEVLTGSPFGAGLLDGVTPFFSPSGGIPESGSTPRSACWGGPAGPAQAGRAPRPRRGWARPARATRCWPGRWSSGCFCTTRTREPLSGPTTTWWLPVWRTASCASTTPTVTRTRRCRRTISSPPGRADSIGYATEPFTARAGFQRVRDIDPTTALRQALPMATRWLAGEADVPAPPGSLGGAAAAEGLAELVETGLEPWQHDHLGYFAIRVSARRLSDASACLAFIGESKAASIAGEQARLVGAMQYPLITGDRITLARLLRRLAPTYEQLRASLPGG
jgi:hypothetical protein